MESGKDLSFSHTIVDEQALEEVIDKIKEHVDDWELRQWESVVIETTITFKGKKRREDW